MGKFRCSGNFLQQCANDQLGFDAGTDCGTDVCDATAGACVPP
jgi:hypothetical protein